VQKLYPIFGILAPLLYISAVLLGGLLRSDYSHLSNAISELTVTGAPYIQGTRALECQCTYIRALRS
jgi:hypothetical membrane protein